MKFRVRYRDYDGFGFGQEAFEAKTSNAEYEQAIRFGDAWLEEGEYVLIEFDTDAGTARVVPQSEVKK